MSAPLDILVIDDDSVDRKLIKRTLQKLPNSVNIHEAATGTEGLALIRTRPIDCVLLDFHLPDHDGIEFLGKYETDPFGAAPAVIMITGAGSEKLAVAAMKAGAHDYITKVEHDPAELWTMIEGAVRAIRVKQVEAKNRSELEEMALTDPVTLIGSRHYFQMQLEHALDRVVRDKANIAVLVMDLDGFKQINDKLGHQAGDEVLRAVADRIRTTIRASDTAARLGGDEFVVIMETGVTSEGAQHLADRIRDKVIEPMRIDHQDVFVGISVGVALYPHNGENSHALLDHADAKMYAVKSRTRTAAGT